MKSSLRQQMADKLSKKIEQMQNRRIIPQTGKEALHAILDFEPDTLKAPSKEKKQIVLYLKDGLTGVERNWTKYPNEIHDVMTERLEKEAESVLYIYLWRKSWGYGRNYCRTSYATIMHDTVISARNTARRSLAGLVDKQFIIKALDMNSRHKVTQDGALYRILTPLEISNGITEEGVLLSEIPKDGVPTQGMPQEDIVKTDNNQAVLYSMPKEGMPTQSMPRKGTAQLGHTTMPTRGMPNEGTPTNIYGAEPNIANYALAGHAQDRHPLKDNKDTLKDTLSPRAIISSFYKGIGQEKISAQKRERAEKGFKELLKDGFSPDDIHFAVKWTLENAKEELYDFSIIKHTVGQAMAAKKKTEEEKIKEIEREKLAAQEQEKEKKRAEEMAKIKAHKENLSADERMKLREKAKAEIRESGQFREEFVTDFLIEIKENEIIRRQLGIKLSE